MYDTGGSKKMLQKGELPVRIWKLFARHMPIQDQIDALKKKPDRPVINVYIGTPNRVKELALRQAINLGPEQFKFFILDTTQNAKGFTVFETHETRDDTFNLLLYSQKRLFKRKLKLYLVWTLIKNLCINEN